MRLHPRIWLTVGALVVPLASMASPVGGAPTPSAPALTEIAGQVIGEHHLTLVTGDAIVVTELSGDRLTVSSADNAGGAATNFRIRQTNAEYFVTPTDAVPYVDSGQLDPDLFDVRELLDLGYGDGKPLPVIVVDEPGNRRTGGPELPLRKVHELPSLPGRNARVAQSDLDEMWDALSGTRARRGASDLAGTHSVWLDGVVTASLDESVPQVGAPAAWAAGYDGSGVRVAVLDTGVDPTHPDLAGKVAAQQNFTTDPSVVDLNGHGTHVASIVAGSGAASDGARQGVAPGAELIVGKVLRNNGQGRESDIISGMEWAVEERAAIVSMSLGGGATDGTDPLARSLGNLSASSDTLFVVAAGNDGPNRETVATPATADLALAVAAVDGSDAVAGFSGRGPRKGDLAVKPEISAPGVAIDAARADGTYLGSPSAPGYRSASGTSMAAPHVSGAAAILAQRHPQWSAERLKAALISSASPAPPSDVFDQGVGRVDVAAAVEQHLIPSPSTLGFQVVPAPGDAPAVDPITLSLDNTGDGALTVDLSADMTVDGRPAPAGSVSVAPATVTVPAGGSSAVDVVVTPNDAAGTYSGHLVAAGPDGAALARVPVGYEQRAPLRDVTFVGTDTEGAAATGQSYLEVIDLSNGHRLSTTFGGAPVTWRLPEGEYSVMSVILTPDGGSTQNRGAAQLAVPELRVGSDTTVPLDAREAGILEPPTPQPTEPFSVTLMYHRAVPEVTNVVSGYVTNRYQDEIRASSTDPVETGSFEFFTRWQLVEPMVEMRLPNRPGLLLRPEQMSGAPLLDGRYVDRVVDAPDGTPEQLAAASEAVAVVDRDDSRRVQIAADAASAGVDVLVFVNDVPGRYIRSIPSASLPILTLTPEEGEALRAAVADRPESRLFLTGNASSDYLYDLAFRSPGQIPPNAHENRSVHVGELAIVRNEVTALADENHGGDSSHVFPPYAPTSFTFIRGSILPHDRVDYISGGDDLLWQRTWYQHQPYYGSMAQAARTYHAGGRHRETWFEGPLHPGMPMTLTGNEDTGIPATRRGDVMTINVPEYKDSSVDHYGFFESRWNKGSLRFFRDDELVAEIRELQASFRTSPETAEYRAELDISRDADWAPLAPSTHSVWTFSSGHVDGEEPIPLQLMMTNFDFGLDEHNAAPAGQSMPVRVWIGHQPTARDVPVTDARMSVSYDDGATWERLDLSRPQDGRYRADVRHPRLAETNGFVAVRVRGTDAEGASVEQTVMRAYRLRAR